MAYQSKSVRPKGDGERSYGCSVTTSYGRRREKGPYGEVHTRPLISVPQPGPFPEIVDLDKDSSHQEARQQELAMDFLQETVGFEEEMEEMQQQEQATTASQPEGIETFLAEMGASAQRMATEVEASARRLAVSI